MKTGFIGLGKMGGAMTARLVSAGHEVAAYARTRESVLAAEKTGAEGAQSLEDLVSRLAPPRVVWVMVPAGDPTAGVINQLAGLLSPGDCIIDGGNSFYKDSMERAKALEQKGLLFLDAGTSGGVWGLIKGYCLMVGGSPEAFALARPLFAALASPGGYLHVGPSGSGHFVKMIHNGIEYGMLQAYAEGFQLLAGKPEFRLDLAGISRLWNQGSVVRSWILELCESVFAREGDLASVRGYVEDSGEGRWTVLEALEQNAPAPVITHSLLERLRSRQEESFAAKVVAALRNAFGGHGFRSSRP